jgi:hypothetical protein
VCVHMCMKIICIRIYVCRANVCTYVCGVDVYSAVYRYIYLWG